MEICSLSWSWPWVLYLVGILIVIGSHVWLLRVGHMADNVVKSHSYLNLIASALIIAGWLLKQNEKSNDNQMRMSY
jgi:hypothetical protein